MKLFRLRIKPRSAFGSTLLGETLFGQLCWTIRELYGEEFLTGLLDGYLENRPFAVVSDGFPSDMMPLPHFLGTDWAPSDRDLKKLKKLSWIPKKDMGKSLREWRNFAAKASEEQGEKKQENKGLQSHNRINRLTSTTGEGDFAPFILPVTYFNTSKDNGVKFDIYVLFDPRDNREEIIKKAFETMGACGFGRDATTGLGRFDVIGFEEESDLVTQGETFMALSGVSLSGLKLKEPSYYKVRTHFGRHGGLLAQSENPFKSPVVTTTAGDVFTPETPPQEAFIGSGIGNLSRSKPSTVHQGYAIIVGLKLQRGGKNYDL